jgi:PAS domain S-box-containing protein
MAEEKQDANKKRDDGLMETLAAFPKLNPNPLLEVDFAGKVTYSNETSIRILKDLGIADPANFLPKDLGRILKIGEQGKEIWFYREVSLGNKIFGLDIHVDHNFKVLHIYGIEITEREKTGRELRKYRGHLEDLQQTKYVLENLLNSSADVICGVDAKGRFIRWNRAAEEIFGYSAAEIKEKFFAELYENPAELEAMLAKLRRDGFVRKYEIIMKKKDGSIAPFNLSINLLYDRQHNLTGSLCIARDRSDTRKTMAELQMLNERLENEITERKRAEKFIKQSLRLRQQILNTIPSPIFYKGIDGRYQGVNQAFLQFYGKTMEQVLGKTAHEVFPKKIADKYLRMDQDLFQDPGIQAYEFHNYDAHGQRREMSVHKATFLDKDGSIAGLAGIMIDITERKKAEEERLRFSKLESLSILAGGIAHDFNNILTAILGNIGLAMLDGKIEPRVQDRLAQAEQACLRAQALSQKLLTFANGGAPIKKIVSIANLLKELAILTLSGSKSRYEGSFPDDLWSVEADTAQLNQVIGNLLINADQAMPEGGIIKITAENISVKAKSNLPISKGKYVKFAIADQGIGISPQYLDKIFDPYFSTKQKGSGLGLATAYSIIKYHSGHIQVESRMGVGTTFYIYLPAADKRVPADELETAKPTMGQGKVLVMDDEEMVREVLGGMLSRLGYEADFSTDGSQAIEKFVKAKETNQPFAAVILDLTIPGGMGGKEAIKELLKIDPQVKAIVSSGYSDDPIMADFQKYGFAGVIAKPYRVSGLGKVLNKALTGKE